MKISIITVAFNSAATIADTLRSVASQTYNSIEHIVIDGGSNDRTMQIIDREGKHLTKVISESDRGIYDAMNKGLAMATGDVVGFLNSDDVLADSDCIAKIVSGFSDDTVDAVFGDLAFVKPRDINKITRYWRPGQHVPGACSKGWMVPHPTFYVRRHVLRDCGGFNIEYTLQADFDLMVRLFENSKFKARYLPHLLVRMRTGGATTSSIANVIRGNLEAAEACRRAGFPVGVLFPIRKILSRLPQFLLRS